MKQPQSRLPKFGDWLLRLLARYDVNPHLRGDFDEEFSFIYETKGFVRAWFWYWTHLLRSLPVFMKDILYWRIVMIRNFIKIAFRNVIKHKAHSLINIMGLAIGMACCMLIFVYVYHESHHDRYHPDSERIYRVVVRTKFFTMRTIAQTSDLVVPEIRAKYPQVEAAARIYNTHGCVVESEGLLFYEDSVYFTEPELFQILFIPVLQGDSASLSHPGNVLLSRSLAQKLFGSGPCLGKSLAINGDSYQVTGLVSDPPSNGHLQYVCFASHASLKRATRQNWTRFDTGSYIKLKVGVDAAEFGRNLASLTEAYLPKMEEEDRKQTYLLQPVSDIHLTRDFLFDDDVAHGNRSFLFILSGLGLVILIIACVNYVNMATARSTTRLREVSVRWVIGAQRRQLISQFLGETSLMAVLAFILACLFVYMALPQFSVITATEFSLAHLLQRDLILVWIGLILFMGAAAGIYPALFLSSFSPGDILKQKGTSQKRGGRGMRRLLTVGQFSVSIFLIITTLTINQQIRFMKSRPLGFEKEQKLVFPLPQRRPESLNFQYIKKELSDLAAIRSATLSSCVPGRGLHYAGTRLPNQQEKEQKRVYNFFTDHEFIFDFGIEWATEPLSDEALSSLLKTGIIVNETLVYAFGWQRLEESLGERIISGNIRGEREIVGVVRDFHFKGLHEPIDPMIISHNPEYFSMITLTVDARSLSDIMKHLQAKWKKIFPSTPFDYFFLDENFDRIYRQDEKFSYIVFVFSVLGISIACFGLLGLAAFMAERRTKEIGIRKVLGSSEFGIVYLLTREFSAWILLANLIAWPTAFWIVNMWLQNFHYRIALNVWIFLCSGAIALGLAWITVSHQAVKAARANPVDNLRYE